MKKHGLLAWLSLVVLWLLPASLKADYTIYPCPQKMTQLDGSVSLSGGVNIVCEDGIDGFTRKRLENILTLNNVQFAYAKKVVKGKTNILLGINGSNGTVDCLAKKQAVPVQVFAKGDKFDKHVISVTTGKVPEVVILGEHTNAVFFALASLEQMLEQGKALQSIVIEDYADLQYRGIVEGYYGYPYSFELKQELMNFFMRYKMNTYLYGAKSDPYHSGFWRKAYPESITRQQESNGWLSQQMIRDLSKLSLETKVNFIWAIHPNSGTAINLSTEDSTKMATEDVLGKFDLMHQLGIRQFAVFLDDAGWDLKHVDNYEHFLTNLQRGMEEKYNRNYKQASDTVMPLHFVPHIYALNFAPKADRDIYFGAISRTPSNVVVYTTGEGIMSSPDEGDFKTMQEHMGRSVALWWNYPCNDGTNNGRLLTGDMNDNLREYRLKKPESNIPSCLGVTANPMQEGHVAMLPLFGVADYTWNTGAFNSEKNWKDAFEVVVGKELAPAYRYFAQYVRHDEPRSLGALLNDFKETGKASAALTARLDSIAWSCGEMSKLKAGSRSSQLLYKEMEPWIAKLEAMIDIAMGYIALGTKVQDSDNEQAAWEKYLTLQRQTDELATDSKFQVESLEDMGENPPRGWHNVMPSNRCLMPFLKYMKQNLFKVETIKEDSLSGTAIGGLEVLCTAESVTLSSGEKTVNIGAGQYFVVNLLRPTQINGLSVSADAVRKLLVETSADGRKWTKVVPAKNYAGQMVKFVRFSNRQKAAVAMTFNDKTFKVLLPHAADVKAATMPEGATPWNGHDASMFADGSPKTFCTPDRAQKVGDAYTIELDQEQAVNDVRIWMGTVNRDFMRRGHVEISADGKTWTKLNVMGTDKSDFTMRMEEVHVYDRTVSYCDFDGAGARARFVRLVVDVTNGGNWLRLHGIQVNVALAESKLQPVIEDKSHVAAVELTDGDIITGKSFSNDWLTYRITSLGELKQVKIYSSCSEASNATINVSVDGENWIDKGRLNPGIMTVDLSDCPNVRLMVIEFTKTPATIYEVVAK